MTYGGVYVDRLRTQLTEVGVESARAVTESARQLGEVRRVLTAAPPPAPAAIRPAARVPEPVLPPADLPDAETAGTDPAEYERRLRELARELPDAEVRAA